ncbi:TetR family transcriptional regulator [Conexibacter sp. W3-3-2]|uniref:TetR/AcrR family transcriptional regulator n=1 Tax=Conexibacter sp. W3-3-2 TaxID=2675227 RepID=UPI0012B8E469|nr:TetR/AcrR family transcriptional regulator [Conexibacter sp. W3-3-2]MTD43700.1 TetR family transcriptional regulator [Conexibacter sp. W3-3-2]
MSRSEQILATALTLFQERGFAAVGVAELGERAGVSGPALYRHFGSKDEILATLFDRALDRLLMHTPATRHEDPEEGLRELVAGQVEFVLEDPAQLAVYIREDRSLAEPDRRRIHRRQRENADRWVEAVRRVHPAADDAEIRVAVHATIGLLVSVVQWPTEALSAPALPEKLTRLALGALSVVTDQDDTANLVERS